MSPRSHCGDEENGPIGLSSWRHCICIYIRFDISITHVCMLTHIDAFVLNFQNHGELRTYSAGLLNCQTKKVCLSTCNIKIQLNSTQCHTRFILTCFFESLWAWLTTVNWNDWVNLLLLSIPYHMQKANFLTELIFEIKLAYYLSSLWACLGIPEHTYLKQPTNICYFMDFPSHPKIQLHTSTYLWDILV